ncbi:MAG TPA: alanine:cation symporter family protein, partial [Pirellulaceae bacterium]|nr:alanine:cation symporter family protein [Pirellulaceae bacterium]
MQRKRSLRRLGFWSIGILALLVGLGWAGSRQDEQGSDHASAAAQQDGATEEQTTTTWIDRVDAFFGDYLVAPMAKVIFFDFGTPNWIRLNGQWQLKENNVEYRATQRSNGAIRIDVIRTLGQDQFDVKRYEFASVDELRDQDAALHARYQTLAVQEHRGRVAIPFVVVWLLGAGIFFTLFMRFINLRAFGHSINLIRGKYDDPNNPGEVTHFQALASALSATVGLGNIAGVAIAIGLGGPGATFWMILAGFLGMTTKFAECTLGQMYRKVSPDGVVSGGPMHYLRDGLSEMGLGGLGKVLAVVFAVLCIGGSLGGGNAFQVGQSLGAIKTEIPFLNSYPWVYGLVMAFFVGIVIIGGIRSIASVASKIVPFMCGAYVLAALDILFHNTRHIPNAFGLIF